MLLAGLAVILSFAMLLGVIAVLVLVRRGDAPAFRASREYDASRRQAVRLLTGEAPDEVPGAQWYRPERREPAAGDSLDGPFREAVGEALGVVVPAGHGLRLESDGTARMAEGARVVPAVSTANLRARSLAVAEDLEIGIVLFNPEPPGNDPRRVALPVQVLFPALERAQRRDLIERFEALAARIPERTA